MTRCDITARRVAGAAALLVSAGLALTGCKVSMTASGTSSPAATSSPASGSPAADTTSPAASSTSPATGTQAAAFFPVAVGNTWVYATTLAGQPGHDITTRMTAVNQTADGQQVTMSVATGTAAPTLVTYVFHPDGSITVPVTQFDTKTLRLTSGSVVWPSQGQLAARQAVTSTLAFTQTTGGKVSHETAHVTVQGGGIQTVTVPAGTYQAQLINETFTQSAGTVPVRFTLQTWVANGVGPVKSALGGISTSVGSIPAIIEELKSFTAGQ
jgi:hypothetical protein